MDGKLEDAKPRTPQILYTTKNKLAVQEGENPRHLKYQAEKGSPRQGNE